MTEPRKYHHSEYSPQILSRERLVRNKGLEWWEREYNTAHHGFNPDGLAPGYRVARDQREELSDRTQ